MFRGKETRRNFGRRMTEGRLNKIQNSLAPDYNDIDSRKYYTEINIKQHSPFGVKENKINLYMDRGRFNSWNIKLDGIVLIHESGKKLLRLGIHRAFVWMAVNLFRTIRGID